MDRRFLAAGESRARKVALMTARTVPPSEFDLPPLRDLVVHARGNLTRGLALSALAHLSILTAVLMTQEREPALRTVKGLVEIVPTSPVFTPPVPQPPSSKQPQVRPDHGIWKPTPMPPVSLPEKLTLPGLRDGRALEGEQPNSKNEPAGRHEGVITRDPLEGDFVYFDQPPVPVQRVQPEYPTWAKENGIAGTVLLHVLVGQDGRVRRISVIREVTGLTEAAQEALRRWTFRPATANGRAVAVWVEIPVEFRLGG
jgi:protein TonB